MFFVNVTGVDQSGDPILGDPQHLPGEPQHTPILHTFENETKRRNHMFDPEEFFDELKAKYGVEREEDIMDSISVFVMNMIAFMAGKADVSFETMCLSLAATYHQIHAENVEESA